MVLVNTVSADTAQNIQAESSEETETENNYEEAERVTTSEAASDTSDEIVDDNSSEVADSAEKNCGTFNYYSADHDSIEVMIDADTARMIGCSRVIAAVYGGGKGSWRLKGSFTLRKQNGTWKLTSSKASRSGS